MLKYFLFFLLLSFVFGCDTNENQDKQLLEFTEVLSGKFSSKEQADKEPGYSSVMLTNHPIWKEKPGYWFYHELYDPEKNATVYYQRILNIKRIDSLTISSSSYIIPNQKKYGNAWKDPSVFNHLTIDSLTLRDGCDVYYKKKAPSVYQGKTKKKSCLSNFNEKISYTTSAIVITKNKITSWDRGYNATGKQVWGKIQGPYEFVRITEDKKTIP